MLINVLYRKQQQQFKLQFGAISQAKIKISQPQALQIAKKTSLKPQQAQQTFTQKAFAVAFKISVVKTQQKERFNNTDICKRRAASCILEVFNSTKCQGRNCCYIGYDTAISTNGERFPPSKFEIQVIHLFNLLRMHKRDKYSAFNTRIWHANLNNRHAHLYIVWTRSIHNRLYVEFPKPLCIYF